jgi:Sec-independent protein translocase protein TatA
VQVPINNPSSSENYLTNRRRLASCCFIQLIQATVSNFKRATSTRQDNQASNHQQDKDDTAQDDSGYILAQPQSNVPLDEQQQQQQQQQQQ